MIVCFLMLLIQEHGNVPVTRICGQIQSDTKGFFFQANNKQLNKQTRNQDISQNY